MFGAEDFLENVHSSNRESVSLRVLALRSTQEALFIYGNCKAVIPSLQELWFTTSGVRVLASYSWHIRAKKRYFVTAHRRSCRENRASEKTTCEGGLAVNVRERDFWDQQNLTERSILHYFGTYYSVRKERLIQYFQLCTVAQYFPPASQKCRTGLSDTR